MKRFLKSCFILLLIFSSNAALSLKVTAKETTTETIDEPENRNETAKAEYHFVESNPIYSYYQNDWADILYGNDNASNEIVEVRVNNQVIANEFYTWENTSFVVSKEYLKTLGEGDYDLQVIFSDGIASTQMHLVDLKYSLTYSLSGDGVHYEDYTYYLDIIDDRYGFSETSHRGNEREQISLQQYVDNNQPLYIHVDATDCSEIATLSGFNISVRSHPNPKVVAPGLSLRANGTDMFLPADIVQELNGAAYESTLSMHLTFGEGIFATLGVAAEFVSTNDTNLNRGVWGAAYDLCENDFSRLARTFVAGDGSSFTLPADYFECDRQNLNYGVHYLCDSQGNLSLEGITAFDSKGLTTFDVKSLTEGETKQQIVTFSNILDSHPLFGSLSKNTEYVWRGTLEKDTLEILTEKDYDYTGEAIEPNIVIKDGSYELIEGKDYVVSYVNNINPGQGEMVVTGKGDYAGQKVFEFNIIGDVIIDNDYKIISGANLTVEYGKEAVFSSNAPFDKFVKVQVDGKDVAKENYTVTEGSTIVTLKPDYVKTLSVGEHTISIISIDGKAETKFNVVQSRDNINESNNSTVDTITNTGDSNLIMLWASAAVIASLSAAIIIKKKYQICKK